MPSFLSLVSRLFADFFSSCCPILWRAMMHAAYMLSVAALVNLMGQMGSYFGKSMVYTSGIFVFGLGGLLCGYV